MAAMNTFPYKRFLSDLPYLGVFCAVAAVVIVLVTGQTSRLPLTLTFSMSIGAVAFVIVDGVRLWLWGCDGQRTRWSVFLPVLAVTAPLAHIIGSEIAARILDIDAATLDPILSPRWFDSVLFTLVGMIGGMLMIVGRERLERARAEALAERARAERIERQAVQAQLQLLRAQLEPHMLFNTLANVQGLIAIDATRAQHMLDQLIQYLRATLVASRAEHTTLAQEFALLEAYLGLMAVRMGPRLAFTTDLPSDLRELSVPPMLLQPLVENAIAHGLEPKVEGGHVRVTASRGDAGIVLTVADDGLGLEAPAGKPGTGVGLSNTRERLKALFGDRARLSLVPAQPAGVIATIHLPSMP